MSVKKSTLKWFDLVRKGDQTRLDARRADEMHAQHLGSHALPPPHLGCGSGRPRGRTSDDRNRKLGHHHHRHLHVRRLHQRSNQSGGSLLHDF